jgi:uncharacterized Zn finger protein
MFVTAELAVRPALCMETVTERPAVVFKLLGQMKRDTQQDISRKTAQKEITVQTKAEMGC